MDRRIAYTGAIPLATDLLEQNKDTMIGLGFALQAVLGTSTAVDGLACTPTSPASLSVNVAPGSIHSFQNVDNTAYGEVAADTAHQIVKQGIVLDPTTFSCPAPATTGQSVVYLIQAAYSDQDGDDEVLPYYNASNPSQAYNGPNNSGVSQSTVRKGVCLLQKKTGIAATTGSQATPAPDAGFVGLFAVTVANGQSTITSGNIQQLASAPFIPLKLLNILTAIQTSTSNYAPDTSGAANTITVALSPALAAYVVGQPIRVKVANTTTNSSVVMNVNGLGNVACYGPDGNPLHAGSLLANGTYTFAYDGTHMVLQSMSADALLSTGASYAPLNSPVFTGDPQAPTPAPADNDTSLATTAFAQKMSAPISSFKNLKIVVTANGLLTLAADAVTLGNGSGGHCKATGFNQTISTGTTGANGLDTGGIGGNGWYHVWAIYNPTTNTVAGIISLSSAAPALPSGYTFYARVGAVRTDAFGNFLRTVQCGREAQYVVGTNPTSMPLMASGTMGNISTPTFVAVSVSAFVPPTASKITLCPVGLPPVTMCAAPNNSYGGYSSSNPPPINQAPPTGGSIGNPCDLMLESSNIYWASNAGGAYLYCLGWEDNL